MRPVPPMSPLPPSYGRSFVVVGKAPGSLQRIREAVTRAFPGAVLTGAETLGQARELTGESTDAMLLLLAPSAAEVAEATEARDRAQLPRWAVVVIGDETVPTEVISLREN